MSERLEVRGVYQDFGENRVLAGCDFTLSPGRIVGLLGHNGAGKSTLLKILSGGLRPTGGTILLDGQRITRKRRPQVAYMADHILLPGELKVKRGVSYYADLFPNFDRTRADALCEELSVPGEQRISLLPKGMAERLDLALLLSRDARLYLLDEPLGGVDPVERARLLRMVLDFPDGERTILMATHLVHDIEPVLDDVLFLREGKICLQASAEELRAQYGQSVEEHYMAVFEGGGGV